MKIEQTECSETSAYKIQTPRNDPEESIQHVFSKFIFYLGSIYALIVRASRLFSTYWERERLRSETFKAIFSHILHV
jgi:hypothetical protein